MTRRRAFSALAISVVLASRAVAGPNVSGYELHWRRGGELSDRHAWADARKEFEAAYKLEPRPILLFNIASTYMHEGDRINARVYYKWYLDKAPSDPKVLTEEETRLIAVAQERLAELDKPPPNPPPRSEKPAEPRIAGRYPREVIDRPTVIPPEMIAAAVGIAVAPRSQGAALNGGLMANYSSFGVLTGTYGVMSRLDATGELAIDLGDARRTFAFGAVTVDFLEDKARTDLGLRGTIGFAFEHTSLYDIRVAAPIRFRLADRLAVVSTEDHLLVTFDTDVHEVLLRVPVGIAYQVGSTYLSLETRLAAFELHAPAARYLFRDYQQVSLGATVVPSQAIDIVIHATASSEGHVASAFVRLRL